jgi:triosephosphate isomerase
LFGQTDDEVNRLIVSIVKAGMTPIVCVGETLTERESGRTTSKVMGQVASALQGRTAEQVAQMVIAYEPIWAIGTGRTATAGDAQAVVGAIRSQILESFGERAAMNVRLQYGGSVKASNIAEIMSQPDIDGVLVGGASLDPTEFARIVQYYLRQG